MHQDVRGGVRGFEVLPVVLPRLQLPSHLCRGRVRRAMQHKRAVRGRLSELRRLVLRLMANTILLKFDVEHLISSAFLKKSASVCALFFLCGSGNKIFTDVLAE